MEDNIEADAASLGRAILSEVIGGIALLVERAPIEKQTPELATAVTELYSLVSASNARVFSDSSAAIIEKLAPEKFKKTYPYLELMLRKSLKRLTKHEDGKNFLDAYAESLMLDFSENIITNAEIENAKKMIVSQEQFGQQILDFYYAAPESSRVRIEESNGLPRKKLEKIILNGQIRLRQLSFICLVLELRIKYTVTDANGDEKEVDLGGAE